MDDRMNLSSFVVSNELESLRSADLIGAEAFAVSRITHNVDVCLKWYMITVYRLFEDVMSKMRELIVAVCSAGEEKKTTYEREYIAEDSWRSEVHHACP